MNRAIAGATLLAAVGLAVQPTPAVAQPEQVAETKTVAQPERETETPADRFGFFNGEQLQVSTGTDDDNLTFSVALPAGPSQPSRFSLIMSTPLHGGDIAMPASLDALANGSRATLRWGWFAVPTASPNAPGIEQQAITACEERRAHPRPKDDPNLTVAGCRAEPINNIVHDYALERYGEYITRVLASDARDFGIEATVGINEFDWVDPATLGRQRERHTDLAVSAYYTQYIRPALTAFTFSASYQRAFEAVDAQLLCPPSPTDPATQCVTAPGAAPNRNEHLLLSAGLRHRFTGPDGALFSLAVAPQLTYDALHDVFGVDVPVYFVPDSQGRLTGGVRFGYRSDREDHFSIGVFIGTTFSLWQQ